MHLVVVIIRTYHDARSSECQSLIFPFRTNVENVIFQTLYYMKYLRCDVFTSYLIYWWLHYCCLLVCVFLRWFIWYYNLFKIIHVVSSVKFTFNRRPSSTSHSWGRGSNPYQSIYDLCWTKCGATWQVSLRVVWVSHVSIISTLLHDHSFVMTLA